MRGVYLLQVVEGEVDVLGLSEQLPVQARLAHSIRSGQIHQVEFGAPHGGRARLTSAQVHREDTVGACGCLVHRSLERREERRGDRHGGEKRGFLLSICCFSYRNNKKTFPLILIFLASKIKATPCVTDEQ